MFFVCTLFFIDVISVAASRTDMQDGNEAEVAESNVKEDPDFV
jgi:hypothetical protein